MLAAMVPVSFCTLLRAPLWTVLGQDCFLVEKSVDHGFPSVPSWLRPTWRSNVIYPLENTLYPPCVWRSTSILFSSHEVIPSIAGTVVSRYS